MTSRLGTGKPRNFVYSVFSPGISVREDLCGGDLVNFSPAMPFYQFRTEPCAIDLYKNASSLWNVFPFHPTFGADRSVLKYQIIFVFNLSLCAEIVNLS